MPRFSIIIPVYNVEQYLPRCLDSILNQSYSDFELLCVDDGSPDSSLQILRQYAEQDNRLTVFAQENQGQSVARNYGLDKATGEYIIFVDSDDCLELQTLEILNHFITKDATDIVAHTPKVKQYTGDDMPDAQFDITTIASKRVPCVLPALARGEYSMAFEIWRCCYKRDLIGELRFIENVLAQDCAFTFDIYAKGSSSQVLDVPLYRYTMNPTSSVQQKVSMKNFNSWNIVHHHIYKRYLQEDAKPYLHLINGCLFPQAWKYIKFYCDNCRPEDRMMAWTAFADYLKGLKKLKGFRYYQAINFRHTLFSNFYGSSYVRRVKILLIMFHIYCVARLVMISPVLAAKLSAWGHR